MTVSGPSFSRRSTIRAISLLIETITKCLPAASAHGFTWCMWKPEVTTMCTSRSAGGNVAASGFSRPRGGGKSLACRGTLSSRTPLPAPCTPPRWSPRWIPRRRTGTARGPCCFARSPGSRGCRSCAASPRSAHPPASRPFRTASLRPRAPAARRRFRRVPESPPALHPPAPAARRARPGGRRRAPAQSRGRSAAGPPARTWPKCISPTIRSRIRAARSGFPG